jgi:hypothetical protein
MKERDGKGSNRICSRFQNTDYYFKDGITFSRTGQYSPTFRKGSMSVFDSEGSFIDISINTNIALGCLSSKLIKLLAKVYLNDYVHMQVEALKELPFSIQESKEIEKLVKTIILKQKADNRYNYMENEQKEIDRLVYDLYGLNEQDVREVETWYARRYPKLAHLCEID